MTTTPSRLTKTGLALALVIGLVSAMSGRQGSTPIAACVNTASGELKIVPPGATCSDGRLPLVWNLMGPQGPVGPQGPAGPPGPAGADGASGGPLYVTYEVGLMVPNTSVARAWCPAGSKVLGGGGTSNSGAGLQQSHPISDETGLIAWGTQGIGWQVAATDWSDVQAYVVCGTQ